MAAALIDTHVHLNYAALQPDLDAVAAQWRAVGVQQLVHACVYPGEFPQLQAIADRYPEVFIATGLHPLDADRWLPELATLMREQAEGDARVVAIGETGLDFFKAENADLQEEAFRAQIAIAQERDLPLIIHCRDAAVKAREILQAVGPVRGVMHCWGGTAAETEWFVELGMFVSFSGIITFKNATSIREALQMVPLEQLLIETDCPFLAPVPHRGKRNEPAFVAHVAETVAAVRGLSIEELAAITTANARRLFRLPEPVALA